MEAVDLEKNISRKKNFKKDPKIEENAKEWIKCQSNPLYFIYNYVYIQETGGSVKLTSENLHPKMKRVVRSVYNYHHAILMASRQLGKSTIAACLIAWAMVFFPKNRAVILNMKKNAALENIDKIRFIIRNLPSWMVTKQPFKQKSEIQTYLNLFNDSKVEVFYPSTVHTSDTLARSLTSPVLYIDEAAFIKDMHDIYGSAQQTLSRAREQAKRNKYPFFTLISSTPNGTTGHGKWFYERWEGAAESDELFERINDKEERWRKDIDVNSYVKDPGKNTFIRIKYHWSEDPDKDYEWYKFQCQDLDDQRKINQELDLVFVGTQNCIFDDDTLSKFRSIPSEQVITTPQFAQLKVFDSDPPKEDYYLIGCDTAQSLNSAFNAIEVFGFRDFEQIAELKARFGSYTVFADAIHYVFQWLREKVGDKILLCVENNTIGQAPIEILRFQYQFDYDFYLYREKQENLSKKPEQYGIKTTGLTKPHMAGCLIEHVNENIQGIKSSELIDQFGSIERTQTGGIRSNSYSDLFMSACFCAYVRSKKAVEIMPLLDKKPSEYNKEVYSNAMDLVKSSDLKNKIKEDEKKMQGVFESEEEIISGTGSDDPLDDVGFLPFFSS